MKWNVKVNDKVKWNPDNPVIDGPQKCGRIKRFFKINKEWLSLICYGQNKWPCIIMMWPFKQGGCKVGFHCTVLEYHWVKIVFTCFFSFVFQFLGHFHTFSCFGGPGLVSFLFQPCGLLTVGQLQWSIYLKQGVHCIIMWTCSLLIENFLKLKCFVWGEVTIISLLLKLHAFWVPFFFFSIHIQSNVNLI